MTTDLAPTSRRSVSIIGSIEYRNARFGLDDLEEIVGQCGDVESQHWLCTEVDRVQVEAEGHKKPASYEVLREYRASTLAELVELAPKGKLYHLEAAFQVADGYQLALAIGEPRKKTFLTKLALTGPGTELPIAYHRVARLLLKKARKGGRWRDLGTILGSLFLTPPLLAALVAWRAVSRVPQATTDVSIVMGVVLAALCMPAVLIGIGLARSFAVSSATLKPWLDTRSVRTKLCESWQGLKSVYSRDGDMQYKTYLVTLGGWIFGILSMVVAILSWLYPRH